MNDMKPLALVIFDNDGVLIDSWQATVHFYNTIRRRFNLADMTPEEERFCNAATWREWIAATFPKALTDKVVAAAGAIGQHPPISMIRRQDRVQEFLALLQDKGIKSAVMTNGGAEARLILQQLGLLHYFDPIVTVEDVVHAKPSGEGLNFILCRHGVAPSRAVFIGDSQYDCDAAKAAGIPFWAYNNPRLAAETHIKSYTEAIEIVGRLAAA